MPDDTRLDIARRQITYAREYTKSLIADIEDDVWFQQPGPGLSHVAWQVAHLAVAEYGLCLFRVRGRAPGDIQLLPSVFRKQFGKGSAPEPDAAKNPRPDEIRQVLDEVHQQVLEELKGHSEKDLDVACEEPHALFSTKLGALFFCSAHEMMHAGQIGLLRRLLGKRPIR
jgi:hypothetical protein